MLRILTLNSLRTIQNGLNIILLDHVSFPNLGFLSLLLSPSTTPLFDYPRCRKSKVSFGILIRIKLPDWMVLASAFSKNIGTLLKMSWWLLPMNFLPMINCFDKLIILLLLLSRKSTNLRLQLNFGPLAYALPSTRLFLRFLLLVFVRFWQTSSPLYKVHYSGLLYP